GGAARGHAEAAHGGPHAEVGHVGGDDLVDLLVAGGDALDHQVVIDGPALDGALEVGAEGEGGGEAGDLAGARAHRGDAEWIAVVVDGEGPGVPGEGEVGPGAAGEVHRVVGHDL